MRASDRRDLALMTLAGIGLRLIFIGNPGHIVDLHTFGAWALQAADSPWDRAYEATNANYPPAALLVFELIGRIYRALSFTDELSLRVALKIPNVVFDAVGGGVLYAIALRFVTPRRALLAAALYDFNPAIVYDSSLWGQNDSITTVTALGAVWCMLARHRSLAWVILSVAVLNKPPVIVLAPLFVLEAYSVRDPQLRRRALGQTSLGIGGALLCGYLLALPFYTDRSPVGVYARMIGWYRIGSSLYPYTSANGFNLHALAGDFFLSDQIPLAGIALKYWADAAFCAVAAAIFLRYRQLPDDRALVEAGLLLMLAFFLVLTEMHERYLLYALAFAPALAALEPRYLWPTVILSVTQWLNLEYSLTYMWVESDKPAGIDPDAFAPVLVHLCVLANVAVFVYGMQLFARRQPAGDLALRTGTPLRGW